MRPAIRAITEMQKAPDFDRKMLLLATQVAHRSDMRMVLLTVLNHLLKTLKFGSSGEIVVDAMTLLRCMIKLILGLLVDPTTNRYVSRPISKTSLYFGRSSGMPRHMF